MGDVRSAAVAARRGGGLPPGRLRPGRAERDHSGVDRSRHRDGDRLAHHGPGPSTETVVTSFSVIPDVTCSGTTSAVPMAWSTRNAQSVEFQVDGAPVTAGAGYAVSGTGNVLVPCDGKEHEVALVAAGTSGRASVSRQVNTFNLAAAGGRAADHAVQHARRRDLPGRHRRGGRGLGDAERAGRQLLGRRAAAAGRRRLPDHRHGQHRRAVRRHRPQDHADGDRHRAGGGLVAVGEHHGVDLAGHADGADLARRR